MKRFFKFALVALATAAVAVACQKPEQQPEKIALKGISLNKQAVELAIGAKETLTVKFDPENVTEKPTIEWSSSAPAVATVAEGEVTAVAAGEATITAKAGSFTATCKVTVKEEQPEPGDFTSPDWANIGAITNGNHTFKFTKDDKNAYFYTERSNEGRYSELWGAGKGYIYFAFDFDGDLTTGEELNGNGKYEYIAFIYCFGGTADAPVIEITADGGVAPSSYTVANVIAKGTADANGAKVEYCVPLADLPQLPENFTIYTWGNKDLSKVEYKYPYEAPEAPQVASWAEAEAAGAIHFFQYRAGSGWSVVLGDTEADSFDNLTVADGKYTISYTEASDERWQSQFYMRPNPAKATLPLKAGKNYLVSLTFKANTTFAAFAKLTQYGDAAPKHEGATLQEWANIPLEAGVEKTVAYVIEGVDCGNVNFTLDFGTHPENTTVEISNVKVEETDQPVGPIGDEPSVIDLDWDYTPSAEYLAETNLWKAVDGDKVGFFYIYDAAGYPAAASDSYELLSFKESTYVLDCTAATESTWANQLFIYPKEGSFIALDPAKTYKVKITVCSNADYYGPFIKLSTYNAETTNHEGAELWALTGWPELINFKAGEPIVKETELTGKEAQNIVWIMGLGGNPAGTKIYIKDIIIEEVGGETPAELGPFDSNVEWAASTDDKAYTDNVLNVTYDGSTYEDVANVKLGTSSKVGKCTLTIPAGTTYVTYWAIGWNGKDGVYKITAGDNVIDGKAAANTGAANTSPYNVTITDADQYMINLGGALPADLPVTIETTADGYRAFFFGIQAHTGEAPAPAPTGIKIDGDLSDWDAVEGVEAGSFKEFKFASDADNIYMYFKIKRSNIIAAKTEPFVFNWRRYIAFGIDADNNAETGTAVTFAGMNIPGCEIAGNFYPFRGTASAASGTDNVEIVNGVEEQGGVTTEIGSNVPDGADKKVSAFGKVDDDFVYVEAGFARADVGSPAAGTIKIQLSLAWDLTDILEYSLK